MASIVRSAAAKGLPEATIRYLQPAEDNMFHCRKCWFGPRDMSEMERHLQLCLTDSLPVSPPRNPSELSSQVSSISTFPSPPSTRKNMEPAVSNARGGKVARGRGSNRSRAGKHGTSNVRSPKQKRKSRELKSLEIKFYAEEEGSDSDEEPDWATEIPGLDLDEENKQLLRRAHRTSGLPIKDLLAYLNPKELKQCEEDLSWVSCFLGDDDEDGSHTDSGGSK